MATLRVADEDAPNVTIAVDGVRYQFEDYLLEVDDATAEGIRRQGKTLFPHLGIHRDGEPAVPAARPRRPRA